MCLPARLTGHKALIDDCDEDMNSNTAAVARVSLPGDAARRRRKEEVVHLVHSLVDSAAWTNGTGATADNKGG